jgi:transcriptional regulator with XRE-family HTH domain
LLDDDAILPSANPLGVQPLFFHHLCKSAEISRKQVAYKLRVSKTLVDQWMSGEKHDPLSRAREVCAMFARQGRHDLVTHALAFIAGAEFGGTVLSESQTEALRQLSKAVTAKGEANEP